MNEAPAQDAAKEPTVIVGTVVSDKMNKTIVVAVERRVRHPIFSKMMRRTTKYYAHDEGEIAKIGDTVEITPTRPLSKLKRHRVLRVVAK